MTNVIHETEVSNKENGEAKLASTKMEKEVKVNRKKKKRKHESSNTGDETLVEPDKKLKIDEVENATQKNKLQDKSKINSDASDNEDNQEVKVSQKESSKLNGKFLRSSFNSSAGFSTLQKFLTICKQDDKRDLPAEYLQAGGSVLEILRLLDSSDKKNTHNAVTVFTAMQIVLMKILAKFPQNLSSAQEACRHLINNHLTSVHSLLSSQSGAKNRKVALKLLAAVVSVGGTLPRELLSHLSFHAQLLDTLVSHTKPTDPESVRTCFIHFVLAFLVEGSATDVRALLDKKGVLSSIFSGLVYDYSSVVQLVLSTVKKYVLENPAISKTSKLHVFSTPVVQALVNSYNWKGPKNWPGFKKQASLSENIDPEEKEITVNIVHEFLITLLTSNRYGIAFHDRSLGTEAGPKHNQLINTVLQSLDKPWEHEKPLDLVVKILTACPDLIKSQLLYAEPFLAPRATKKWGDMIRFITKIIQNIDEESCLSLGTSNLTTSQFANAILNLVIPQIVMRNAVVPSLQHDSTFVRHEITVLLLTMMKKLGDFMTKFEKFKSDPSENSSFKNIIQENILKYMPNFETILNVWMKGFSSNSEMPNSEGNEQDLHVDVKDHLVALLDLLEKYNHICPEAIVSSIGSSDNKPSFLLSSLCNLENISDDELTILKVKALKILLCFTMSDFSPNEAIFSTALSFLASKVDTGNATFNFEAREALHLLLSKCEIFEGFNDQIEIWIDSFSHLNNFDDKLEVANWIAKLLKRVSKNSEKYVSLIHQIEENAGGDVVDLNKYEIMFDDLSERDIDNVKSIFSMLPVTSISLLTYAAAENLRKPTSEAVKSYMSIVLTHILHCQISTSAFTTLVEELNITVHQYLLGWSKQNSSVVLKKPFKSKSIFSMISKLLLVPSDNVKISVEKSQLLIQLEENGIHFVVTNFEMLALIRMVTFYLTQSLQKSDVKFQDITVYRSLLLSILQLAHETNIDSDNLIIDCLSWIFKHPVILQNFQGFYKGARDSPITKLITDICSLVSGFEKQHHLLSLLHPYQDKFITQLKVAVKKCSASNTKKIEAYTELIEYLQLDIETVDKSLQLIMTLPKDRFVSLDKSTLSVWGKMTPKLIEQFYAKPKACGSNSFTIIADNLMKKLFSYLIELKITLKQETEQWENSLYNYLIKFAHSVSAIDERIFTTLMKSEMTQTTKRILIFLTGRNPKLISAFVKYAKSTDEFFQQPGVVFSVLSSNLRYNWEEEFLNKIFNHYKAEITNFLTEPGTHDVTWIHENEGAVSHLMKNTFDLDTCEKICHSILSNGNKLDSVKEEHVKLYFEIFKKRMEVKPDSLKDFVQVLVLVTVTALKKDSKNLPKLNFLCNMLIDSIDILKKKEDVTFEELSKHNFWSQFTRLNLKLGLKLPKKDEGQNSLLKALVATCDIAYKENSSEEYVKTIFEMTTSHSEFVNVMLSNNSHVKNDLIELLLILVRKNHSVMSASQIPLYLAAYNGTLAKSDQLLLKVLQYYESNKINLSEYRPYLWGSAAASHYSVKGDAENALFRQPSTSQVLDLLTPEMVKNTINHFPGKRNWENDFTSQINTEDQIYDPAFYLPLFSQLLSENNVVACHKIIHSGALALAIIACSSTSEQIRLSAYTVISRFYFHLEATSSKDKLLWINFIDAIRNGIVNTELPLKKIRLNGFVATFLARTCLAMTQPLNPLYSPLTSFLMAKPALDVETIPELLQLYHSSEVEHQAHRHWILEVIRDGIQIDVDVDVAMKCVIFKMLFDFYTSKLSDKKSKILILEIVKSSTKLPKPCMILLNGYALLPWLISATNELNNGDIASIRCLVNIVNNILNAIHETKSKEALYYLMLMKVMISLKSSFTQKLSEDEFKNYVSVLTELIINDIVCKNLTKNDVGDIILFSRRFLQDVSDCELMLQYGCKFVKNDNSDSNEKLTLRETLHKFIIKWFSFVRNIK